MTFNRRQSEFKKGIDVSEGRRQRHETNVRLRKDKKEEGLAKRRAMIAPGSNPIAEPINFEKDAYGKNDISALMQTLSKPNTPDTELVGAVRGFRKMLSVDDNPPVKEVIEKGVLPLLTKMLTLHDKPQVQFEAAWALTNIASTDRTKEVVDVGAVPLLAGLLASPSEEVREQSAWCLGNIAGDSTSLRDAVLSAGAMVPLLKNIEQPAHPTMLANCVWSLSNFCRGKPSPPLHLMAPAVPFLADVIKGSNENAKIDALWAFSYISDGTDDRIQTLLDAGVTETLVETLGETDTKLLTPCLRTVGNIVSGNDIQTQAIIDAGLMHNLVPLLHHQKKMIRKETCWVMSNIAAGTPEQLIMLMRTKGCMVDLIGIASNAEWEVRKEAVWAVSNVATAGSDNNIIKIVEYGAIEALCSVLEMNDTKMVMVALDAIDHILRLDLKLGKHYASFVDECDGLAAIENLQRHISDEVFEKAVHIIETYFGTEDGDEDENLAPMVEGDSFAFGLPSKSSVAGGSDYQHQPIAPFNFAS